MFETDANDIPCLCFLNWPIVNLYRFNLHFNTTRYTDQVHTHINRASCNSSSCNNLPFNLKQISDGESKRFIKLPLWLFSCIHRLEQSESFVPVVGLTFLTDIVPFESGDGNKSSFIRLVAYLFDILAHLLFVLLIKFFSKLYQFTINFSKADYDFLYAQRIGIHNMLFGLTVFRASKLKLISDNWNRQDSDISLRYAQNRIFAVISLTWSIDDCPMVFLAVHLSVFIFDRSTVLPFVLKFIKNPSVFKLWVSLKIW